ncbi:MAG: hypothetical protein JXA69_02080 [Phycisphaerae bacterium]|nr:hypothetical protein [Phycisphaerae bacterium]
MTRPTLRVTAIALTLALCSTLAPAQEAEEEDLTRPTELGLRFTPGMARAMSSMFAKQALAREWELDEDAQGQAAEAIARRMMEFAHENEKLAQPFFEFAIETLMENHGRFTPETGRRWAELSRPLIEPAKVFCTKVAEDIRPLIPPKKQPQFAAGMMALGMGFQLYEKKMDRWAAGKVGKGEHPFDVDREKAEQEGQAGDPAETDPLHNERKQAEGMVNWETVGRWRHYLNMTISYYDLDDAQKKTGEAILTELEERAAKIMDEQWKATAIANRIKRQMVWRDGSLQNTPWEWHLENEYEELTAPIQTLRRELQTRLDELPTTEQRSASDGRTAEKLAKQGMES